MIAFDPRLRARAVLDKPVGGPVNFFNVQRGAPAPLAYHGYQAVRPPLIHHVGGLANFFIVLRGAPAPIVGHGYQAVRRPRPAMLEVWRIS